MRKIPKVIEEWIQDPVPDTELGKRILKELAGQKANLKWEEINIGRGELKRGARQSMEEGRKALVAMKARRPRGRSTRNRNNNIICDKEMSEDDIRHRCNCPILQTSKRRDS